MTSTHVEVLYDVADIPISRGTLVGMEIRRDTVFFPLANLPGSYDVTVDLSVTTRKHAAASRIFDKNHGPNRTRVFSGRISLPFRASGPWPAPWEKSIVFSRPFAYVKPQVGSLVADWYVTNGTNRNPWWVEAYNVEGGTSQLNWDNSSCRSSTGKETFGSFDPFQPFPGGKFALGFSDLPRNLSSMQVNRLVFGLQGKGGRWAGRTLPFLLSAAGIPSSPCACCSWSIDYLVDTGMRYFPATGYLQLQITMPNDPSLIGKVFYTQGFALDRVSQGLVVFPTVSRRWQFGTGRLPPETTVYGIPAHQDGFVSKGEGLVTRFLYR